MNRDNESSQSLAYFRFEDRLKTALKTSLVTIGILLGLVLILVFEGCYYGVDSLYISCIIAVFIVVPSTTLGLLVGYLQKGSLRLTKAVTIFCAVIFGGFGSFVLLIMSCGAA